MLDKERLLAIDRDHLIHPMTHPRHYELFNPPRMIVEARGYMLKDAGGRELIDGFGGLWCVSAGHCHPRIVKAVHAQMQKLCFFSSFQGMTSPPSIELAEKVVSMLNPDYGLDRIWFTSGGSETNETNIKLARLYHALNGKPEKYKIVSRRASYHGMGLATTAATGMDPFHVNVGPLPPGFLAVAAPYCYRCEFGKVPESCGLECARDLDDAVKREGPDTVAAFIAEPVIGAGGVIPPPPGYFDKIRSICDEHDMLLILDEVITGFGRTGKMFGHEHGQGVRPDMLSLAKGISSGHVPLGASVIRGDIYDLVGEKQDPSTPLMHGFTYMNHPVSCAAGLANIAVIEDEGLVEKAAENGDYLIEGLKDMAASHPSVGEVRGLGMMAAIEFVADRETREPIGEGNAAPRAVTDLCWENGLYVRSSTKTTVSISPPLVIGRPGIDKLLEILGRAVAGMEERLL